MSESASIEWTQFGQLDATFTALIEFDAMPLMERWADIIVEGNRRGVLAGLDGHNNPMPALQYRDGKGKKTRNRQVGHYGTTVFETTGFGPHRAGLHDNLTTALYSQLTGPRLAPRGEASRVIKNLHTEIRNLDGGTWEVVGAWLQVVSNEGVPFLPFHFEGDGRLPRYDLRPVRPEDLQFAANALRAFVKDQFLRSF
jgi:hypothetical protein